MRRQVIPVGSVGTIDSDCDDPATGNEHGDSRALTTSTATTSGLDTVCDARAHYGTI